MSDDQHCKGVGGAGHRHGISCREVSEFLLAYIERDLDEDAQAEFDRHLERCPPCVHYLDSYRDTVSLVHACGRGELDAEERRRHAPPEDLIQAILRAKRAKGAKGAKDAKPTPGEE
ncbi:hypothetical protein ENSA5_03380 [Enhygromyxa salina]|uniref:Putative zinc-finger domain-containing protein n=1 Tax=Enhygromyxa salina TaxID=215803 RepID=A0A2S9YJQ6_9BACT|nr:zf-HC2 domain-containing protein [Enhygromyxa salina]PRQ05348.1 hypothetical protein ENSA5_03380 [Enhygromyxa salina]